MLIHNCAEIMYEKADGTSVHSDICWQNDADGEMPLTVAEAGERIEMSEKYKQFVMDNLREWLDNSGGTGCFYIGSAAHTYFQED